MTTRRIRAGATVAAALLAPLAVVGSAQADEPRPTDTIRASDLIEGLSDTRPQGTVDFLREGLRIETGQNTAESGQPSNNKAAEYWAAEGGIPASGSYVWRGTAAQPGTQVVFDTDGDRQNTGSFNVLVGEQVYSTNARDADLTDFWYTGGSARATSRGIACPSTTTGSGSDCHGTLAEWQTALPNAQVYAYGFSLGSGVVGQGLLSSVTFGDQTFGFTSEAEPTPEPAPQRRDVNGTVSAERDGRSIDITMTSQARPENTEVGDKLRWRVTVVGQNSARYVQGFDEVDEWSATFKPRTGAHTVRVFKNGEQVREYVIRTGR